MAAIEPAEDPRPTKNRRRFLYFLPAIPLMAAAATGDEMTDACCRSRLPQGLPARLRDAKDRTTC